MLDSVNPSLLNAKLSKVIANNIPAVINISFPVGIICCAKRFL